MKRTISGDLEQPRGNDITPLHRVYNKNKFRKPFQNFEKLSPQPILKFRKTSNLYRETTCYLEIRNPSTITMRNPFIKSTSRSTSLPMLRQIMEHLGIYKLFFQNFDIKSH
jgi:hypothetical protein